MRGLGWAFEGRDGDGGMSRPKVRRVAGRITYLSADEVNREVAAQLARSCGVALHFPPPGRPAAEEQFFAAIYDLDHPEPGRRGPTLEELTARPSPSPVAIHGHGLDEEQLAGLLARSVIGARRLDADLFRRLCNALEAAEVPRAAGVREAAGGPIDPITLAAEVRALASRSYRTLARPGSAPDGTPEEMEMLLEHVARLRQEIDQLRCQHKLQLDGIRLWAEALQARLRARRCP